MDREIGRISLYWVERALVYYFKDQDTDSLEVGSLSSCHLDCLPLSGPVPSTIEYQLKGLSRKPLNDVMAYTNFTAGVAPMVRDIIDQPH